MENPQLQSPLNRAASDKFILIMDLPYLLKKNALNDPFINVEPLQMSVFGSVVPDIQVPEIDVRYKGQNMHVSSYARPNYPPLTVNFTVDNAYNNYYILWKWLDAVNLAIQNIYGGGPMTQFEDLVSGNQFDYQTTLFIQALDEYNQPTIEFIFTKAFLTGLGAINYSYRTGSQLIESAATFHYSQLDVKKIIAK
jgi:hypothetical protein